MQSIRTDLAAERHSINAEKGVDDGIIISEEKISSIAVTKAEVLDTEGEQRSGCKMGVYYTADVGKLWLKDSAERALAAEAIAALIKRLLPEKSLAPILAVGLGNEQVTPDAIGPKTVEGLVVSHHMKLLNAPLFEALELGDLAAIRPGVLGQTGMESAELIKAAAEKLKPSLVIAVDALAAGSTSRLGTTVQISNAGIAPGSGINNRRKELSEATMGCPVIAIGIPTVVDARTIAAEISSAEGENGDIENFFVTPKDADIMIRVNARLLSTAINAVVHEKAGGGEEYAPL